MAVGCRWSIKENHPNNNNHIKWCNTHCVTRCSKCFLYIMTFNYPNNPEWLLLSPFYIWKTWGTKNLSNFFKVPELVSSSVGFHPRQFLSLCYKTRVILLCVFYTYFFHNIFLSINAWKLNLFKLWQKYTVLLWQWALWLLWQQLVDRRTSHL